MTRFKVCLGLALLSCASIAYADHPTAAFGGESAGPINTISASQMAVGSWAFGLRSEIISNEEFTTEQLEGFAASGLEGVHSTDRMTSTSLSLSYGVIENLSLSVRLPHIKRENIREGEIDHGAPEVHTHGDSSGVGDLLLLGQYRLLERGDSAVSILVGLKAPTGETDVQDNDGTAFEAEFQPGSGSWDYLLGGAISKSDGQLGFHANILFNITTEGTQSTEIGDATSYNAALTYRLNDSHAGHDHDHGADEVGIRWDLSIELNGETRSKNKIAGVSEENSGGTTVYISPGLRISSGKFSGFVSYGVPIVEDHNGVQTDVDSRIVAGISFAL